MKFNVDEVISKENFSRTLKLEFFKLLFVM